MRVHTAIRRIPNPQHLMMSFQDYRAFSKYRKEESIALFVETLTGTTFEMSVFPHDTIMSIKSKIQRIGGIPIGQQHLLYNFQELDDSSLLTDYSIKNGSTIKLVLSMRGGPISTVRRILPLDDAAIRELMESNRDELLDDLPPGCKMAVLVFRDGDQLNMFRVLENVDGSYSPLSDSSMLNLFEDEGMLKADEFTKRLDENTVTMEKMYDLKTKLAELAIQRKTHKLRPEEADENQVKTLNIPSTSTSVDRASRGSSKCKLPSLPPISSAEPREAVCASASLMRKTRTSEFSRVPVLPEIASRASPSPRVAVGDSESSGAVECVTSGFERERPRTSPDDDRLTGERVCQILSDASRLSRSRRCTALPVHRFPRVPPMANTSLDSDQLSDQDKDKMEAVSCLLSVFSRPRSGLERENANSGNMKNLLTTCKYSKRGNESPAPVSRFKGSSSKMSDVNETDIVSSDRNSRLLSGVLNDGSNRDSLRFLARTSRSKDRCPSLSLESNKSTSSHPTSLSTKSSATLNTRSRLLSREGDGDRSRSNFYLQLSKNSSNSEFVGYPDESSFTLIDDERFLQDKSFSSSMKVPTVQNAQNSNFYESRVKKKKKEPKTRCTVCRKRLTITNTYTCRCGSIFCNIHRYSEAHDCDYDYKEEGRRILEQNNPLITAPKLPKI